MVVPPKHPKMIILSRKTHGCWVPPFKETPIWHIMILHIQKKGTQMWLECLKIHLSCHAKLPSLDAHSSRPFQNLWPGHRTKSKADNLRNTIINSLPETNASTENWWEMILSFWALGLFLGANLLLVLGRVDIENLARVIIFLNQSVASFFKSRYCGWRLKASHFSIINIQ